MAQGWDMSIREELVMKQNMPLDQKVEMTQCLIEQWWHKHNGQVYIGFSGGKDSTVLLHIVRSIFPDIPAVFSDTGLEYPEIKDFVKTKDNVIVVRPDLSYRQVITKYGYPVVSKQVALKVRKVRQNPTTYLARYYTTGIKKDGSFNARGKIPNKWMKLIDAPFDISERCCDVLKKRPFKKFEKESGLVPFIGTMVSDSQGRRAAYLRHGGCNVIANGYSYSAPMSFWQETDVWDYIKLHSLPYSDIYNMGYDRTGCMWCMFGSHIEKCPNRFQRMRHTHPKLYDYAMDKIGLRPILEYIGVPYE